LSISNATTTLVTIVVISHIRFFIMSRFEEMYMKGYSNKYSNIHLF